MKTELRGNIVINHLNEKYEKIHVCLPADGSTVDLSSSSANMSKESSSLFVVLSAEGIPLRPESLIPEELGCLFPELEEAPSPLACARFSNPSVIIKTNEIRVSLITFPIIKNIRNTVLLIFKSFHY